jgi:hypothetical protein
MQSLSGAGMLSRTSRSDRSVACHAHDEHNGSMVLIALLAVIWPALAPVLAGLTVVAFVVLGLVVWRVLIPRARAGTPGRYDRPVRTLGRSKSVQLNRRKR